MEIRRKESMMGYPAKPKMDGESVEPKKQRLQQVKKKADKKNAATREQRRTARGGAKE